VTRNDTLWKLQYKFHFPLAPHAFERLSQRERRGRGDKERRGRGDKERRGRGDKERRRQGEQRGRGRRSR
jgi:hypothetical protein